jgi:hypothetical protein
MANLPAPPRGFDLSTASSRSLDAEVIVGDKDVYKGKNTDMQQDHNFHVPFPHIPDHASLCAATLNIL